MVTSLSWLIAVRVENLSDLMTRRYEGVSGLCWILDFLPVQCTWLWLLMTRFIKHFMKAVWKMLSNLLFDYYIIYKVYCWWDTGSPGVSLLEREQFLSKHEHVLIRGNTQAMIDGLMDCIVTVHCDSDNPDWQDNNKTIDENARNAHLVTHHRVTHIGTP